MLQFHSMQTQSQTKLDFLAGGEQTLNNKGYMTGGLDPYSKEFIEYAAKATKPVLDIGACYGIATLPALQTGARVIANDIDARHLEILRSRVPLPDQARLECVFGSLPNQLSFPKSSLSAILCCRVLHFLTGAEIEQALHHMYEWLEQGGRIYLINDTPYARYSEKLLSEFAPQYEQRQQQGDKWPGYIVNLKYYLQPEFRQFAPEWLTLTGPVELARACLECGFEVLKSGFIARPDYPSQLQNDGRECAGVIAVKK